MNISRLIHKPLNAAGVKLQSLKPSVRIQGKSPGPLQSTVELSVPRPQNQSSPRCMATAGPELSARSSCQCRWGLNAGRVQRGRMVHHNLQAEVIPERGLCEGIGKLNSACAGSQAHDQAALPYFQHQCHLAAEATTTGALTSSSIPDPVHIYPMKTDLCRFG